MQRNFFSFVLIAVNRVFVFLAGNMDFVMSVALVTSNLALGAVFLPAYQDAKKALQLLARKTKTDALDAQMDISSIMKAEFVSLAILDALSALGLTLGSVLTAPLGLKCKLKSTTRES